MEVGGWKGKRSESEPKSEPPFHPLKTETVRHFIVWRLDATSPFNSAESLDYEVPQDVKQRLETKTFMIKSTTLSKKQSQLAFVKSRRGLATERENSLHK